MTALAPHPSFFASDPPVPRLGTFYDPVLKVLGRRTGTQPYVLVKLDEGLRAEIVREAGFDPEHLPDLWWRTRKDKPHGLYRQIGEAYRFQNHPGKRGRLGALTIPSNAATGKRNWWGLTEAGAILARRLLEGDDKPKPNKPNATSRWLSEHLTPKPGHSESELMKILKAAVAKKCPVSASMDQIEDHVQQCFLRLIRRDALRTRLERGEEITYTHLATYAVRSAYTDVRDAGTEPICREMFGARTEKERQDGKAKQGEQMAMVGIMTPGVEMSESRELMEVTDTTQPPDESLAERLNFEGLWSRLVEAIQESKPHAYERYVGLLRMQILDGFSVKEIAEKEGVSPHRAATMLQEARRAVRDIGRSAFH